MSPHAPPGTVRRISRPASLRSRVVLAVLALLVVLLVVLLVAVDLALSARLRGDLRTRLTDRVALAEQLDGALSAQQLVDRLTGDGVQVQLCSSSGSSSGSSTSGSSSGSTRCVSPIVAPGAGRPSPPDGGPRSRPSGAPGGSGPGGAPPSGRPGAKSTAAASFTRDGSTLYARATLPQSGQVLSLSVDEGEVGSTIRGLVLAEVIGGLVALVVAAVVLGRVVGVALRPLDQMTRLARRIASGDRGRRLQSSAPDTEIGRTADAFDAMLDELESALADADDARLRLRRFLGDATHELRSPLAGLRARAEQLLRDEADHAAREQVYVAMIREADRANRLVDDLLTVSRVEEAPDELRRETVDLRALAEQEAERIRLRASAPTIELRGAERAIVDADPQRLAQVLGNLLDNAARAARSRIEIVVHAAADESGVDVIDDGPGVPEADRDRIFERLVRLDESRARHTGGFGLGLPIARGLARAHGGDVTFVDAHYGAHFRLSIPSQRSDVAHRTK